MVQIFDPLQYKKNWNQFSGDFDNRKEIEFYDQQMFEYAAIRGIPIIYYPISVDDYKNGMDIVYGENSKPKWEQKFSLVGILEDFTQEVRQFGAINLENIDEISFYIHRSMFDQIVGIRTNLAKDTSMARRGAYGPIAGDQISTPHNGLVYEVLEGGLHFLSNEAQAFGHKFWYKVSCKSRQVSDATLGKGEQYGAMPDPELDEKYKGNPQFLLNSPTSEELYAKNGTITPVTTGSTGTTGTCSPVEYVTVGTAPGPLSSHPPTDLIDQSGNVSDKYIVEGMKDNSLFRDNEEIKTEENTIINPETDHKVDPDSEDGKTYGPIGRIIPHTRKELFKDWE